MQDVELRAKAEAACERIRDLSGDVSDTLAGSHGPGCEFTYRGSLLYDLLDAALILRRAYLAECRHDCMNCGMCEWCIERSIQAAQDGDS